MNIMMLIYINVRRSSLIYVNYRLRFGLFPSETVAQSEVGWGRWSSKALAAEPWDRCL